MIGLASFGVTQKKDPQAPPGPPFVATSADDGLSVDPVTGRIVLGNDVGNPLTPAQLLKDREIITNFFRIFLRDFLPATFELLLSEQRVQASEIVSGGFVEMHMNGIGGAQITALANAVGADAIISATNGAGSSISAQTSGGDPFVDISNLAEDFQLLLTAAGILNIKNGSGLGNGITIDPVINDVASTGTLSSADPGSGVGNMKFGQVVAGAVAPDGTKYWEIEDNGVVYKVILAV